VTSTIPYLFHRSGNIAPQMTHLANTLDPNTILEFDTIGVGPGWRCLEVGAGGGSIATHLAGRVGPTGHVTATDLRIENTQVPETVRLLCHDVSAEPIPDAGEWNLIHARLVLQHLPDRFDVVAKLGEALRPGGWLVLEDFDCRHLPVVAAPTPDAAALFGRVTTAILDALTDAGADIAWGIDTYRAMRAAGLIDAAARTRSSTWDGGSSGCLLHATNTVQLADELAARGLDQPTLGRFRTLMMDPRFSAQFYLMVTTRGRRPGPARALPGPARGIPGQR
jgi:SAM-dependent methyltransferase